MVKTLKTVEASPDQRSRLGIASSASRRSGRPAVNIHVGYDAHSGASHARCENVNISIIGPGGYIQVGRADSGQFKLSMMELGD